MRNPNYNYIPDPDKGGWAIVLGDMLVWGKTQAAARSRLKRKLRERFKDKTTEEIYSILKGEGGANDQS
jgi:hypothetical protein